MSTYRLRTSNGQLKAILSTAIAVKIIATVPGRWSPYNELNEQRFVIHNPDQGENGKSVYSVSINANKTESVELLLLNGDSICAVGNPA